MPQLATRWTLLIFAPQLGTGCRVNSYVSTVIARTGVCVVYVFWSSVFLDLDSTALSSLFEVVLGFFALVTQKEESRFKDRFSCGDKTSIINP